MEPKKLNLNTHEIRVLNGEEDTWYPKYHTRPKIIYEAKDNPKAPDAPILFTADVTDLPKHKKNLLYIVNRDTISAVRKIESRMQKASEYIETFKLVRESPEVWRGLLYARYLKGEVSESHYKSSIKFINRFDLRAPGEQVRDKDSKVTHCIGLISEYQ